MAILAKKLQEHKIKAVAELKNGFCSQGDNAPDFIFTDYRGLKVEQITNLRKQLLAKSAVYKVVKNSFARLAFEELKTPDLSNYLIGPTAIAVAQQDSNEVAKILFDFIREAPALKIKGALVGNVVYTNLQTEAFSRLPGKMELISMLMSVMNGPARNFTAALNDIPARLVRTVKAIADQKA